MRGGLLVLAALIGGLVSGVLVHLLQDGTPEGARAGTTRRSVERDDGTTDARMAEFEERLRLLEAAGARAPAATPTARVSGC